MSVSEVGCCACAFKLGRQRSQLLRLAEQLDKDSDLGAQNGTTSPSPVRMTIYEWKPSCCLLSSDLARRKRAACTPTGVVEGVASTRGVVHDLDRSR